MTHARHILTLTGASLLALLVTWGCATLGALTEDTADLEGRTNKRVDEFCVHAPLDDCRLAREQAAVLVSLTKHARQDFAEAQKAAALLEEMLRR